MNMNKIIKIIVGVLIVAVIAFTGIFLLSQYNSGKIGNKAEKIAATFEEELEGTWTGKYSISKLYFDKNHTVSFILLGQNIDGTYKTIYDFNTDSYTISVNYSSDFGISLSLSFTARIEGNTLVLNEKSISALEMKFTKYDGIYEEEPSTASILNDTSTKKLERKYEKIKNDLIGKWISQVNSSSGYQFNEDGTVGVTLIGLSYNGDYNFFVDDSGKLQVTIYYATVAGLEVKNSFYVNIDNNILTLIDASKPSVKLYYTRAD